MWLSDRLQWDDIEGVSRQAQKDGSNECRLVAAAAEAILLDSSSLLDRLLLMVLARAVPTVVKLLLAMGVVMVRGGAGRRDLCSSTAKGRRRARRSADVDAVTSKIVTQAV